MHENTTPQPAFPVPPPPGPAAAPTPRTAGALLVPAALGAAVALALGTYGRVHAPTGEAISSLGFASLLTMKAWLGTAAAALALAQLTSALWLYGRLPGVRTPAPAAVAAAHRWTGTAAFLLTLPVAYHCLWSLGLRDTNTRVLVHSIFGCAFYGAFTAKMLGLRSHRLPVWGLPLLGGALVALLTGIWLTSSLWFFTTVGFPGT